MKLWNTIKPNKMNTLKSQQVWHDKEPSRDPQFAALPRQWLNIYASDTTSKSNKQILQLSWNKIRKLTTVYAVLSGTLPSTTLAAKVKFVLVSRSKTPLVCIDPCITFVKCLSKNCKMVLSIWCFTFSITFQKDITLNIGYILKKY